MKKLIILLSIILITISCNKENNKKDYQIKTYVTGYFQGKVNLKKIREGKLVTEDSALIKKSRFKFKHVKLSSPEMLFFDIDNGNYIIRFFADPADMQINADFNKGFVEVQGSETHKEYISFTENDNIYRTKLKNINRKKDSVYLNYDTLLLKTLDSAYDNTVKEEINFIKKYALENNKSFVSLYLTTYNLTDYLSYEEIKKIFDNFDDTLKISPYYNELKNFLETKKMTQKGMQAPDFSLPDTSGTVISLSSLQGKYVLLNFSASWNGYCRTDNKILGKLYKKYKNKNLEILQISAENDKKQWKNVINADKIKWISLSDIKGTESDILKLYGIRKLPYYFLLDKNGIIIESSDKLKKIEKILNEIFL